MAEHQPVLPGRRPTVLARDDLGVGAADPDGDRLDKDRTIGLGRIVYLVECGRAGLEQE